MALQLLEVLWGQSCDSVVCEDQGDTGRVGLIPSGVYMLIVVAINMDLCGGDGCNADLGLKERIVPQRDKPKVRLPGCAERARTAWTVKARS